MWLRETNSPSRALVVYETGGLTVHADAIDGKIKLLDVSPSDIGVERLGQRADVTLIPNKFLESQSGETHYLKATIKKVNNVIKEEKRSPVDSSTSGEKSSTSTKATKKVSPSNVTSDTGLVTVNAWVNVVSAFAKGPDYVQQKIWIGEASSGKTEFPLVINKKYEGKLVRSNHKYRFKNVTGNYNNSQQEMQLVANRRTAIKHLHSKSGVSKPKWRDP